MKGFKDGFEATPETVSGLAYSPTFIRRKSCKTVISVLDPTDIELWFKKISFQIQELYEKP